MSLLFEHERMAQCKMVAKEKGFAFFSLCAPFLSPGIWLISSCAKVTSICTKQRMGFLLTGEIQGESKVKVRYATRMGKECNKCLNKIKRRNLIRYCIH